MKQPNSKTVPGGLTVIFEGLDGVGKTTQLKACEEALKNAGYLVHPTRNLGGTPIGEELRKLLFSHIERPALTNFYIGIAVLEALIESVNAQRKKGAIVLIDRGPMSLAAYQSFGSGVEEDLAWQHADRGMAALKTDLTIYYTLDTNTALKRALLKYAGASKSDFFESQNLDYHNRVKGLLNKGAERYHAHIVDASQTVSDVTAQSMELITQLISA